MTGSSQDHYFAAQPAAVSSPRTVTVSVKGLTLDLASDAGVFSARELDLGTRVLLDTAPMPQPGQAVLDLGCGYGPIALVLAARQRDCDVVAVDINARAVALTRANAAATGLGHVRALQPADVPADATFDAIYSNPPIRIGKPALHALLNDWLTRLTPDGRAYLVVARNLGADSLAGWLADAGFPVRRLRSQKGYRVFEVAAHQID